MTSRNDNVLSVTSIQTQGYFYTKTHVFLALLPKPQVSLVAALTEMKKKDLFSFTVILFKTPNPIKGFFQTLWQCQV